MQRPSLPDLRQLPELEVSSEEGDEEHMLQILQKLKSAKSSIDSSKQKKRNREVFDEQVSKFSRDAKDLMGRFDVKWSMRLKEISTRHSSLLSSCHNYLKEYDGERIAAETGSTSAERGLTEVIERLEAA
eukprot:gene39691-48326_t